MRNCNETNCRKKEKNSGHVTHDCVSELHLISTCQQHHQNQAYHCQRMARKPSSRPFAVPKSRNLKSENLRTVQNRTYRLVKRGIELSEHRDDGAFRTA